MSASRTVRIGAALVVVAAVIVIVSARHSSPPSQHSAAEARPSAERVLAVHADKCPVARSIGGSIGITTGIEYL